ncbi:MAG TPA: glycosyltransferase family 39 protein [bacterium]|mgnify:CR=1 FL=1|nr:glycosyltransferase family 39 protein [bacterium]HQP99106.1 glycosyltransferase family 39 protein [bacterium]
MLLQKRFWIGALIFFVTALIFLAAAYRCIGLETHPPGFFRDEADKGYTSYLLWRTGKDSTGKPYPLFVRSLRVTTSALYQYVDIPFIAVLGLNERAVRLPAALAGCGAILVTFLLARRWWGLSAGLWAAGFLSVCPWHFLLSRWANQSIFLTLWIPLGVFWYDCFLDKKSILIKTLYGLLSAVAFSLALYTYEPARLFIPLFLILISALAVIYRLEGKERLWILLPVILFVILAVPMAHHILTEPGESGRRFRAISIFGASNYAEMVFLFVKNYLAHFSPLFLFFGGDANLRHSVGFPGQIQIYLLPLWIAGIWGCMRQGGYRERLLLGWLLLFPVAAACTNEGIPHALRSVFALPVLHLIAVVGGFRIKDYFVQCKKERVFQRITALWCIGSIYLVTLFFFVCFSVYPIYSVHYWEYGYRDAIHWWMDHQEEYPRAVITGMAEYPEVFFLFYGKEDPERWIASHTIPNVEFLPTGQSMQSRYRSNDPGVAYLVRPGEIPGVVPQYLIRAELGNSESSAVWIWVGQPLEKENGIAVRINRFLIGSGYPVPAPPDAESL